MSQILDSWQGPPEGAVVTNKLYYGDNLDVLTEKIAQESVDLIYLDPPFNSQRAYNLLFTSPTGDDAQAQVRAFEDMWLWTPSVRSEYERITSGGLPGGVSDTLQALYRIIKENAMMAYLVMMAPRLVAMRRVLKSSGSIYLHCDPTASHYLKILMDAIFRPTCFQNEIIWRRTGSHKDTKRYGPLHDVILFYTKSTSGYCFNVVKRPYMRGHVERRYTRTEDGRMKFTSGGNVLTGQGLRKGESGLPWRSFDPSSKGRHWAIPGFLAQQMSPEFAELGVIERLDALYDAGLVEITKGAAWPTPVRYLQPGDGNLISDIWAYQPYTEGTVQDTEDGIDRDVAWLGPTDPERLGYPTQKPVGLLQRIIECSTNPDDLVMDPFCGCGTALDAAQRLGRRWIGIDISFLSVDVLDTRIRNTFGEQAVYEVDGVPRDVSGANDLFARNPLDFERWAVSLANGEPNDKQVGDEGIDGRIRFPSSEKNRTCTSIVSVKGGDTVNPSMVRDLVGTVASEHAEMGLLITRMDPTPGMKKAATKAGTYTWPVANAKFPKVQILTVAEFLDGNKPQMPTPLTPYMKAEGRGIGMQAGLFNGSLVSPKKKAQKRKKRSKRGS